MKKRILLVLLAVALAVSLATLPACKEEPVEFSLKITAVGEGTTSPKPGTSTITEGESVTVTAIPDSGYKFDYWEGNVSGTTNPITFKMKSDMSVVAVFVEGVVVEEWEWPEKLALITTPGVGLAFTTSITSEMAADTGMAIRVVPETNTMLRFKWLAEGRFFQCAEAHCILADVLEALRGNAVRDAGPYQMRLLYAGSISEAGYIVRGDSDIKTIYDIKPGTRIVEMVFAPGTKETAGYALIAWAGVDPGDIVWVPGGTFGACMRFISDGRADVCFAFPAAPEVMEAVAGPHGIRWLSLNAEEDPEGAKRFLACHPTSGLGVMSQSPEAMGVWGIVIRTPMIVREEADPELVYHFAKWLDENYDLYKDSFIWNQYTTLDNTTHIVATSFIPAHDGLIKYLKEKGLWTAANDARQAQNIELITRYVEAYQEAIHMADEQGITVDPHNEEWMELWENRKQELGLPKFKVFAGLEE